MPNKLPVFIRKKNAREAIVVRGALYNERRLSGSDALNQRPVSRTSPKSNHVNT